MSQGQVSARKKSVNVKPTVRQQRDCDCVRGQDDKALEAKQWNDREDREIICMKFFYKFIVLNVAYLVFYHLIFARNYGQQVIRCCCERIRLSGLVPRLRGF